MGTLDYRRLCVEIFGTDDVDKLKELALQMPVRTSKAGRKRKFAEDEVTQIRAMRAQGMSAQEIAEEFHTSRQVVTKYLVPPLDGNYTMRMTYMFGRRPCTIIDVDFMHEKVRVLNQTPDILHRAFGIKEDPDWEDFQEFLADRCFPSTRGMMKETLSDFGLSSYDPLQIVEKTKGRVAEDDLWIKIKYRAVER